MKSKALTLAVVAVALAVGTYFGLNAVAPQKHHEEEKVEGGPTVDDVFAGSLNLVTEDAPAAEVPTEDPALAPGPAPGEVAEDGGEETAPIEDGTETAVDEATDGAAPVAENTNTDIAVAAPAAEESAPAAAEPAPEATPEPAPAPKPQAKPEPKKPAAKPVESKPASEPKPAKAASTDWWGHSDSPDKLGLSYAGSAAYRTAIVLIFNRAFDTPDSANTNIKVTDAAGKTVAGKWELNGNNRAMLVFPVQKTGRYTVAIKGGLTDLGKSSLGKSLKGPVNVK